MARSDRRHVVILAGGKGTRFWPEGRETRPKQVLALDGDDRRPLLRATVDRVAPICEGGAPWIVAPRSLAREIRRVVPDVPARRFLWEPEARNTTAAVAFAAAAVAREAGPQEIVVVVPADHHVEPAAAYRRALSAMAERARRTGRILTLGLRPTFPATGYGYLALGPKQAATAAGPVYAVDRYVEKPALAVAKRYVRGGRHLWNGGTFAFSPEAFLVALMRHEKASAMEFVGTVATRSPRALARAYRATPKTSVDYAVMEKERDLEVLAARLDWDDLGSWDAVTRHARADGAGNVMGRGSVAVDAKGNLVRALDGTTVALLGVDDLVVVRTKDALLVARRGCGEDVRRVVAALEKAGRKDLLA